MEQSHKLIAEGDNYYEYLEGYRRLVYLVITRLGVSYIVHVLAQFMHRPQRKHWYGALRVVRYLKGCLGQGVLLRADSESPII